MCFFHCLASALPHSFRVSVSLLSETLPTLSNFAKNSALSVSCAPSTDVSGYAPVLDGARLDRRGEDVLRAVRGRRINSPRTVLGQL